MGCRLKKRPAPDNSLLRLQQDFPRQISWLAPLESQSNAAEASKAGFFACGSSVPSPFPIALQVGGTRDGGAL